MGHRGCPRGPRPSVLSCPPVCPAGERPFVCLICLSAFTTKANCERHLKVHTDTLNGELGPPNPCGSWGRRHRGMAATGTGPPRPLHAPASLAGVCHSCGFISTTRDILYSHLVTNHMICQPGSKGEVYSPAPALPNAKPLAPGEYGMGTHASTPTKGCVATGWDARSPHQLF